MEWFIKLTKPCNSHTMDDTHLDTVLERHEAISKEPIASSSDEALVDNNPLIGFTMSNAIPSHPLSKVKPTTTLNVDGILSDPPSPSKSIDYLELNNSNSEVAPPMPSPLPSHLLTSRHTKPLEQSKLCFPKVGREEYDKLERKRALKRKAEDEALDELEAKLNEENLLLKCLKAQEKKRRQRKNKKLKLANEAATQISQSCLNNLDNSQLALTSDHTESTTTGAILLHRVAELSRPHRQSKSILSGQTYDEALVAAKHAAVEVGYPWSPAEIVKRLKLQYPVLFEKLRPQRISDWRDGAVKDKLKWKDNVLKATQDGNRPGGASTRQPLLENYPEMVSAVKDRLIGLRTTGTPLDTAMVRGFMIATIAENAPQLFEHDIGKGKKFRCSSNFIRTFLHKELNWSLRWPTQAAQKIPANAKQILLHAFLRMACAVRDENIPSCCIVNSDQTQVVYSPGTQYTWHTQGDKQVPVLGKEEKRAFTLLVGISNNGQLLPLQAIYQGASNASLPHPSAPGYAEAMAYNVSFVASMTATYWSTLQTMKDYVIMILVPFFQRMISTHQLPDDQRCIWQIDVWSVHCSAKFRDWLSTTYPWIILQYVPGGCTGLFQACDVGLQKIAKAAIRQKSLADIINETTQALRNGVDPKVFVNNKSIGTLRNRSVSWVNEAIKAVNKPELIRKAFALCAVPETPFNLSYDSLTSHEACQAIRDLKNMNPTLYGEIASGRAAKLSEHDIELEDDDSASADELSAVEHAQIVMQSSTAAEVYSQAKKANLDIEDSDDESIYEPSVSEASALLGAPEQTPAKRNLPRRATREHVSYALQWWNEVNLED
ncbi:DDE superfamily endonuclease, partial [Rhizoctonia solani AG-3 Rhs1AP]